MIVVAVGHLLVTCAPVAKVVAFDDAGILEQPYRPVDRGNRDAVVDRGATPVELLDVGMIVGGGEYPRDHAALLGHPHPLGGAQRFDVSRLRRVHDASPSHRNITAWEVREQSSVIGGRQNKHIPR